MAMDAPAEHVGRVETGGQPVAARFGCLRRQPSQALLFILSLLWSVAGCTGDESKPNPAEVVAGDVAPADGSVADGTADGGDGAGTTNGTDADAAEVAEPECVEAADCEASESPCKAAICDAGMCGFEPVSGAIACADGNDCTADSCADDGSCVHAPLSGTSCSLYDPCDLGECTTGSCKTVAQAKVWSTSLDLGGGGVPWYTTGGVFLGSLANGGYLLVATVGADSPPGRMVRIRRFGSQHEPGSIVDVDLPGWRNVEAADIAPDGTVAFLAAAVSGATAPLAASVAVVDDTSKVKWHTKLPMVAPGYRDTVALRPDGGVWAIGGAVDPLPMSLVRLSNAGAVVASAKMPKKTAVSRLSVHAYADGDALVLASMKPHALLARRMDAQGKTAWSRQVALPLQGKTSEASELLSGGRLVYVHAGRLIAISPQGEVVRDVDNPAYWNQTGTLARLPSGNWASIGKQINVFNPSAHPLWSRELAKSDTPVDLVRAGNGDLVMTSWTGAAASVDVFSSSVGGTLRVVHTNTDRQLVDGITPEGSGGRVSDVTTAPDGDVVVSGIRLGPDFVQRAFVTRLTSAGHFKWMWQDTKTPQWHASHVTMLPDGAIAVAGNTTIETKPPRTRLTRLESNGQLAWQSQLVPDGSAYPTVIGLHAMPSGDLVLVENDGTWIVRMGPTGKEKARRSLKKEDGLSSSHATAMAPDNTMAILGGPPKYGQPARLVILGLDSETTLVRPLNMALMMTLGASLESVSGGDWLVGSTVVKDNKPRAVLIRLRANGETRWSRILQPEPVKTSPVFMLQRAVELSDGRLLMSNHGGWKYSDTYVRLSLHDGWGNAIADKRIRTGGLDRALGLHALADGTALVGGMLDMAPWVARIDPWGHISCSDAVACVGPGADCDDGNPCTADDCAPATGCTHVPLPAGATCSKGEACVRHACASPGGACEKTVLADGAACSDGNECSQGETCQSGTCQGGGPYGDGQGCSDGNPCTIGDHCDKGVCKPKGQTECNDYNFCTNDKCTPEGGCESEISCQGLPCDDKLVCTTGDTCDKGLCKGKLKPDGASCHDGSVCISKATCQEGACVLIYAAAGEPCDDGQVCTQPDGCDGGGLCIGKLKSCLFAGQPCVVGVCDADNGKCLPTAAVDGQSCSDGDPCTAGDVCKTGQCAGSANDGGLCYGKNQSACEAGSCKAGNCVITTDLAATSNCDDGNACTWHDACDKGVCKGEPLAWTDGLACKAGAPCVTQTTCTGGTCAAKPVTPPCDDGNPCTLDACKSAGGGQKACQNEFANDGSPCDDGQPCTKVDSCKAGKCIADGSATCAFATLFDEPFVCGKADKWDLDTFHPAGGPSWAVDATPAGPGAHTGSCALNFNNGTDYDAKNAVSGTASTAWVTLPAAGDLKVRFWSWHEVETNDDYDLRHVELEIADPPSSTWWTLTNTKDYAAWTQQEFTLPNVQGEKARLHFHFYSGDAVANDGRGWFIDDVQIQHGK